MNITSLLPIDYPIIQGAMAEIAVPELVAAVSNAGGLGVLAISGFSTEVVQEHIRRCKTLTDRVFGVNLMMQRPNIAEIVKVVIEEGVRVVTTGAGTPKAFMPQLKAAGIMVIPVIPSAKVARKMQDLGADAVIASGMEGGGHIGELATLPLIPQVVDAVSIPVIAAGGIADARGVVAAFALGAQGVQMGTRFIATTECPAHLRFKQAIVAADDTATVVTGRRLRHAVRTIANSMTARYLALESDSATPVDALEALTIHSLHRAAWDGDIENGSVMAGQGSGLVKEIKPCRAVIVSIWEEAEALCKRVTLG